MYRAPTAPYRSIIANLNPGSTRTHVQHKMSLKAGFDSNTR
jgi:hypothetical protein